MVILNIADAFCLLSTLIVQTDSHFFDNLLLKLDVLLPLVTRELHQNMVDVGTSVICKLLNLTIIRQPAFLSTENYY